VIRTLRWRWWTLVARARLRRLGGRLVIEARGMPRLRGPLRLETGPRPGTIKLRIGENVTIGRECILDLADGVDGTVELGEGAVLQSRVRLQPWGGAIRIGSRAQIRDGCELKSRGELRLGERAICGRNATLHVEQGIDGDDYLIADDKPSTHGAFSRLAAREMGAPAPKSVPEEDLLPILGDWALEAIVYCPKVDSTRARERLGWTPQYRTIEEGMPVVVRDYKWRREIALQLEPYRLVQHRSWT
jgi:acetyltransferase-like isoleucine patch superfamily enzyme